MATKRIENLVKSVNSRLQPLMEFDRFYAALYDPIRSLVEFPWVLQDGKPVEWVTRPYQPAAWLLDSIIHAKAPRLVEQNFEQELKDDGLKYWPEGDLPRSWLATPMIAENRVIGVLVVENRRKPKAFGENSTRVLSTAARQAAVAIENARLVDQRDRKIASLSALYEMGQKLNSGIRLGEVEILQLIYDQTQPLMDTSNLYIALYDKVTDTVSFPLMYVDGSPFSVPLRKSGKGRTEWIIQNQKPILIETRAESVAWYKIYGHEYIGEPFASWVGVPMLSGDNVLGVIATYHKTQDYVYSRDDQEVLSLMANQAAVAIENARLYSNLEERTEELQKRNKQLAALQEIGVEITSQLELDKALGSIVEHANQLLSADFSTLFTYGAERGEFGKGIRKGKVTLEPSIPSNTGYSGRIAQGQQVVFVQDAESEQGIKPTFLDNKKVRSFAGVPLVVKGKTVGILYVNYLEHHCFSKEEQGVIGLLANQAAVAIENAWLYADMERRVKERTQAWLAAQEIAAIAERKQLEAEKWAELGKTAGSLAHRIGNKGGIIRVCLGDVRDRLHEKSFEDQIIDEKLDAIERSNEYLLEMSDLLFKPVQASSARVTHMAISLLIADAIKSAEIPHDVTVIVQEEISQLPPVPANKAFVEVFTEVITNALTAMESSQEKKLTISGQMANGYAEIRFTDTGVGVPADKMEQLFDLFTQLSEKPIGLGRRGFGLWWVKSFLSSIGGEVWGASIPNKGSTFTIKLPLGG